jgi:hypothetical protein
MSLSFVLKGKVTRVSKLHTMERKDKAPTFWALMYAVQFTAGIYGTG